jgi:hypothetical protein
MMEYLLALMFPVFAGVAVWWAIHALLWGVALALQEILRNAE